MKQRPACLAITFAACTTIATISPSIAAAKIAVFVDGRILKVADAYLEGDQIVLDLGDGGHMVVPALRIDRVVADEVEDHDPPDSVPFGDCPFSWSEDPLPRSTPFRDSIQDAARSADLNPRLLTALVEAESAFDPQAVSRVGAAGLTQLMPAAAAEQGVHDPFDPTENLRGGAGHLRSLLDRFEDLALALAAYNAGAATVERYDGIPPYLETRGYIRRVLDSFCPDE